MSGPNGTAACEIATTHTRLLGLSRDHLRDAAFLVGLTSLPAFFYTRRLGFYLDDHLFLGMMSSSDDQSIGGLFSALSADPKAHLRPVEYFLIAVAYRLLGTNPLPYHIALAVLVPLCAVALYALLVRLRLPRYLALATPVLFASAPHYSSDKFWPDAFSPTLTLTLALISVYAGLSALEGKGRRGWGWLAVAVASMLASIFLYEITLPLFAVAVLYHWFEAWRKSGRWRYTAAVLTVALAGALVEKLAAAARVGQESSYGVGFEDGFLHHMAYLVSGAVKVNFGTYGIGLPYVLSWTALNRLTWTAVGAGTLVGLAAFVYLVRGADLSAVTQGLPPWRDRPAWRYLAAAGLAVVIVGYGLFLTGANIFFTSAGIDNRVNIIATLGMVLIALALLLGALRFVSVARRPTVFALAVAVLAAVGTFITTTIAGYWQEAADRQDEVLSGLRTALPADPVGMTVLLDGVCPEVGPSVVFTAHYDLGGALQTVYGDPTIQGVVMTPVVSVESAGMVLTTVVYDRAEQRFYPYSPALVVYDSRRHTLHSLATRARASAYLASVPRPSCPPLRSFAWGLRTSRYLPFN